MTIEGLNRDVVSPVQQAIIDEGASQCGFCTPGIVVSLTGYLIDGQRPVELEGVKAALGGHLCRCTGYRSLKACTRYLADVFTGNEDIESLISKGLLPAYFGKMSSRLRALSHTRPQDGSQPAEFYIAGGTDVYVQTDGVFPSERVTILDGLPEMEGIVATDDAVDVGALTTFEEFGNHSAILDIIPDIRDYMFLVASLQIRNRATLGGNIVNASPIGDMTILLLALGSVLVLRSGSKTRSVPMDRFYLGYKQLEKSPDEVLTRIRIPRPAPETRIGWEKVSKRKCLDIASVNSALRIRLDGDTIEDAVLAVGGVAPVPLLMSATGNFLRGRPVGSETVLGAAALAQEELSPISDVRGSATYKRLLVRQQILAHFDRLYPEHLDLEEMYEPR